MADDKTKRGAADRIRINIKQAHEVTYWTKALGCTKGTLTQAVAAVGPMVSAVKRYLIEKIKKA